MSAVRNPGNVGAQVSCLRKGMYGFIRIYHVQTHLSIVRNLLIHQQIDCLPFQAISVLHISISGCVVVTTVS